MPGSTTTGGRERRRLPPGGVRGTPDGGAIGVDESGKGDYFGPLVAAGICVPPGGREVLAELGVRDSKTVSDRRAHELARAVREAYPTSVVVIGPERYNALYASMRNLNRLLAWAHARVIENLLERVPTCREAISDQFGDARSEEHTSELQSRLHLVCRLLLEKKKKNHTTFLIKERFDTQHRVLWSYTTVSSD